MRHCASIDLEDWYFDVEHVVPPDKVAFAQAFDRQLNRIESILDEANVRCTFFALGRTVERHPQWIKRLHAAVPFEDLSELDVDGSVVFAGQVFAEGLQRCRDRTRHRVRADC